jgi:hypothetical protein
VTREAAEALLGCGADARPADVRRKYQSLYNDYQIRLTNAPTQALRRRYQKSIQELQQACEVLAPGASAAGIDLPSSEPTFDFHNSETDAPSGPTPTPVLPTLPEGFPRSTLLAGVAICILLTLLTTVGLAWQRERVQRAALAAINETALQKVGELERSVLAAERLFSSQRVRVRNRSRGPMRILAAAVVYSDDEQGIHMAHSGSYGYPTWDVRPEEVVQLDAGLGRGRDWDGRVLSYALLIEYGDAEPFLKTGVWSLDIDRLDTALPLSLD